MKFPTKRILMIGVFISASVKAFSGEALTVDNPSFEDPLSSESKIHNWKLVPDPQQGNWDRWSKYTGNLAASEGTWLLYANSNPVVALQLLRDSPIVPGTYTFSMDAGTQHGDGGVLPRGVQLAIYAIPTDAEDEQRFTLLGEKTVPAKELAQKDEWFKMEVKVTIPADSALVGQFFQIHITSAPAAEQPDPAAPLPAQVVVDNIAVTREDNK